MDYVIIELPAGAANFIGEMAHELIALVDKGTIRVIDLIILVKNEDGSIDADLDESGIDPRRSALIAYAGAVPRRRESPGQAQLPGQTRPRSATTTPAIVGHDPAARSTS